MRKVVLALGLGIAMLGTSAAPALAAAGTPQRPSGPVVPIAPSDNGGDNGWGNCGHNSSRGNPHSDPNGGGNGGYKKGDACGAVNPTDPGDGGGTGGDTGGGDTGGGDTSGGDTSGGTGLPT